MTTTSMSSRKFRQNAHRAQKAAQTGPVFITNRSRPAYVLLSYAEYQQLTRNRRSIVEALTMPGLADIEMEFPSRTGYLVVR